MLRIKKSVLELAFTFSNSDLLDLVNFDFLDLAKFAMVHRFLILPSIPSPAPLLPISLVLADIF